MFQVGIQKLLKSDMAEPGKTETRLKLQAEHRKNLKEFDKKIVNELDAKVGTINRYTPFLFAYIISYIIKLTN